VLEVHRVAARVHTFYAPPPPSDCSLRSEGGFGSTGR
jgi:dUTPase